MKILYGVVGEGMGHATRSCVILEHLARTGHELRVVVSGRAHKFLTDRLKGHSNVTVQEIHGLHLTYDGNTVDKSQSLVTNLEDAPQGVLQNVAAYRKVAEDGFTADVVVSDFESWAFLYALNHRIPVISIDNMQVINRCTHAPEIQGPWTTSSLVAKWAVKMKLPNAYHYLITSFFFPEVRKPRTSLVPPILRPQVLAAKREPGDHVLVYQTASANQDLIPVLQKQPHRFRVYGMGRTEELGNVSLRAFSDTGFVDDLRTARAVIAGGGFSLMGEAVHLRVPMLSVPLESQHEQELNARYLQALGYGMHASVLTPDTVAGFLANTDSYAHALEKYLPQDNTMTLNLVDEVLARAAAGEHAPARLHAPAMGKYAGEDGGED